VRESTANPTWRDTVSAEPKHLGDALCEWTVALARRILEQYDAGHVPAHDVLRALDLCDVADANPTELL
jgi:hypothetical protein